MINEYEGIIQIISNNTSNGKITAIQVNLSCDLKWNISANSDDDDDGDLHFIKITMRFNNKICGTLYIKYNMLYLMIMSQIGCIN